MVKNEEKKLPEGKKWVLVMDEASAMRSALRRMLEKAGYRVYLSGSGDEAVECYKTALDCGYPFDAVVVSPAGAGASGGGDAIKKLLDLDPDATVIIAGDREGQAADFSAHGFNVALAKTSSGEELDRVLRLALNFGAENA